jgi:hypothetical protein
MITHAMFYTGDEMCLTEFSVTMAASAMPRTAGWDVPTSDMVEWVMNHFMIRGTNGPMQRVLDLRTRCLQFNKL